MRTLEQIGHGLVLAALPGTDNAERRAELFAALRAADAELARGREAEALLRRHERLRDEREIAQAVFMQTPTEANRIASVAAGCALVNHEQAVSAWLAAHPPREGETR